MTGFKHALFFYQIGKHAEKTSNTNKVSLTQNSRAKHLIGFPLITDYPTVFKKKFINFPFLQHILSSREDLLLTSLSLILSVIMIVV